MMPARRYETCRRLKADRAPRSAGGLLTAKTQRDERTRALALGAVTCRRSR
jgi:CheY-like chemotaxis protein